MLQARAPSRTEKYVSDWDWVFCWSAVYNYLEIGQFVGSLSMSLTPSIAYLVMVEASLCRRDLLGEHGLKIGCSKGR